MAKPTSQRNWINALRNSIPEERNQGFRHLEINTGGARGAEAVLVTDGERLAVSVFNAPHGRAQALFLAGPGRLSFKNTRLHDSESIKAAGFKNAPAGCFFVLGADGRIAAAYAPVETPGDGNKDPWDKLAQFHKKNRKAFSHGAILCKASYDVETAVSSQNTFSDTISAKRDESDLDQSEHTGMSFKSCIPDDEPETTGGKWLFHDGYPVVWNIECDLPAEFDESCEAILDRVPFSSLGSAPTSNHCGHSFRKNPRRIEDPMSQRMLDLRKSIIDAAATVFLQMENSKTSGNSSKSSESPSLDKEKLLRLIESKKRAYGKVNPVGDVRKLLTDPLTTRIIIGAGGASIVSLDMSIVDGQHSTICYSTIHRLFTGTHPQAIGLDQSEEGRLRAAFEAVFGKTDSDGWDRFKKFFASSMTTRVAVCPVFDEAEAKTAAKIANDRAEVSKADMALFQSEHIKTILLMGDRGAKAVGSPARYASAHSTSSNPEASSNPENAVHISRIWPVLCAMLKTPPPEDEIHEHGDLAALEAGGRLGIKKSAVLLASSEKLALVAKLSKVKTRQNTMTKTNIRQSEASVPFVSKKRTASADGAKFKKFTSLISGWVPGFMLDVDKSIRTKRASLEVEECIVIHHMLDSARFIVASMDKSLASLKGVAWKDSDDELRDLFLGVWSDRIRSGKTDGKPFVEEMNRVGERLMASCSNARGGRGMRFREAFDELMASIPKENKPSLLESFEAFALSNPESAGILFDAIPGGPSWSEAFPKKKKNATTLRSRR